jgi:DNA-binding NarL/FixJ family response regulator
MMPTRDFVEDYPILRRRGMSHREIAAHLGCATSTVHKKVWRARQGGLLPPLNAADADLTARQLEVLQLLDAGLTQHEIARKLFLEHATVRNHATDMRRKLGAQTCAHAVGIAYRLGILRTDGSWG